MRPFLFFISIILFLYSCGSDETNNQPAAADTAVKINTVPDTALKGDTHYFWSSRVDAKKGLVIEKVLPLSDSSISLMSMIDTLNLLYPEIIVKLTHTSGDTAFLKIPQSSYLTTHIGSTGAEGYMAELIYNITEVKGINYVQVNFKPGDHAEPGIYARTDFIDVVHP